MNTSQNAIAASDVHEIKIVGICSDRRIQKTAKRLIHGLVAQSDGDTQLLIRWLEFRQLSDLSRIESASGWIIEADLFLYAGDAQTDLPGATLDLLGAWSLNRRSTGAIVALLRAPWDHERYSSPAEDRLRLFAQEAGHPLFLRRIATVTPDSVILAGRPPKTMEAARLDLARKHVIPIRRHEGGIRGTSPRSKSSPRPSNIVPTMVRTAAVVSPSSKLKKLPMSGLSRRGDPLFN